MKHIFLAITLFFTTFTFVGCGEAVENFGDYADGGSSNTTRTNIINFIRAQGESLTFTGYGTGISTGGSTTFKITAIDNKHVSIAVSGVTDHGVKFTNAALSMKIAQDGSATASHEDLRTCRYNSFTAKFTLTESEFKFSASYQTAAYASYSISKSIPLYQVGDLVTVNGKTGVVFYVDKTKQHGKVVSCQEAAIGTQWSSEFVLVGADDTQNGANNMSKVKSISGWQTKFPAFAWCATMGADWYLPAIEELKLFTTKESVHDKVNYALRVHTGDGSKIASIGSTHGYWASNEHPDDKVNIARYVNMRDGSSSKLNKKSGNAVRAIAAF